MIVSPFFHDLRTAYRAELDDLTFDSEGGDVLRRRLAEKRREIGFLVQMMEVSPEMVAVVFHQGFSFPFPAVMDNLLGHEADEFPEWASIAGSIEMAPWARELSAMVLKEPGGEWFMAVAAGLEYMASRPVAASVSQADDERDDDEDADDETQDGATEDRFSDDGGFDGGEQADARARREAGDDWMVEQGFDRKD